MPRWFALIGIAALLIWAISLGYAIAQRGDKTSQPPRVERTPGPFPFGTANAAVFPGALSDKTVGFADGFATYSAALRDAETQQPINAATREADASRELPGTFVPSQGRGIFYGTIFEYTSPPFCDGVSWSGVPDEFSMNTPAPFTPVSPGAPSQYSRDPVSLSEDCYRSNPPTSGRYAREQSTTVLDGVAINIPPLPGIYPPELTIPRAVIPLVLERGSVFVGWNCAPTALDCVASVLRLTDVVRDRIENHAAHVVLSRDSDLLPGEIGLAAWTRVDRFDYQDFDRDRVVRFIEAHSCRFDPEGFCR